MWLTATAIKRPLFMLMAIGALLILGLVSWTKLGVDLFPALDYPVVSVVTAYPGAGPEAVDSLVTRRVEDAVAGLNDIDYIQSTSSEGVSNVVIVFTEKASKDAALEVERRVTAIRGTLPQDIRAPSVGKFDPNAQPILQLSLGGQRDLGQLQRIAEDSVQKRLEAVNGVARVALVGGLEREVQVHVDQRRLQARGLSILQVNQALAADNLNAPAGNMTEAGRDWTVRVSTQAERVDELNAIMVASTPTGPVYLRDVAAVVDSYKPVRQVQRTDGRVSLGIAVVKQATANTIETADAVKRELTRLEAQLPPDVRLSVVSDQSTFVKQSVHDVQTELTQAIFLTGLVLLVFLHTLRSTIIVLLAIPTSLIATLGVMYALGLSFNMMSLLGLTLTVGILVDDSIVVLENIFRHLQQGEAPDEAAVNGRSEIGLAAIAITLVDVVVFTPIAFMSGVVGQYFREFGLVIATATLFSLFVSFTLTPLLASRWYRRGQTGEVESHGRTLNPMVHFARLWNAGYARLERAYARILAAALRWRWAVVGLGVGSFVGGILLVTTGLLSSEFMPAADSGQLLVTVEMPAGTTLEVTSAAMRRVEERLLAWPEADRVFATVGVGSGGFSASQARFGRIQVELKKKHARSRSDTELAAEARTFGRDIPGAVVKAAPISMFSGGTAAIQVRIQGEDQQVLTRLAAQVADVVRRVPGTANVSDGGVTGQPELVVTVDRARAADLGLTPAQVAGVVRTALAGSTVGTFRPEGTRGWDIVVILPPDERARAEQVAEIPLVTPRGSTVRLSQVADIRAVSGPTQVNRRNRQRLVAVTAGLEGRPLGDVVREIDVGIRAIEVPAGYSIRQGGEAQSQEESFTQIYQALGLSVVMMYMLMVALFESLLFPFIIMLSLPLAVVGAFGLLALTGNTLNIMSLIGMILLTGLVGKNAILLVDFTNSLRRQGVPREEALLRAGPTRLRPILMTTVAIILAMLPLAMRLGEGSEWRAPMAITVIGGLITSSLLTLVMIPAVYTLMDDFQGFLAHLPSRVWRTVYRLRGGAVPLPPASVPSDGGEAPEEVEPEPPRRAPRPVAVPVGGAAE